VNRPIGFSTEQRVGLVDNPIRVLGFLSRLAGTWWHLARAARRVRRDDAVDAVVVGYLGHFDVVLARILFRRLPVVLDHLIFAADTARDRRVGSPAVLAVLGLLDRVALRCADIIVVDTEEHRRMVPAARRKRSVVVAVGAPPEWFEAGSERPEPATEGPLKVVFFGLFTPLQGAPVIAEAVASLPRGTAIEVTMVGGGQDLAEARARAGESPLVTWIPWMDPEELAGFVADQDVCLGIFGATPKGRRVVPNKLYQGAAAGCALVTSGTGPQRRVLGDAALYVEPGDPGSLARVLGQLADDRRLVSEMSRRARELARCFTPHAVVEPLAARLEAGRDR
jgi:glycosyltransferase involved in cell wall biosynthesis